MNRLLTATLTIAATLGFSGAALAAPEVDVLHANAWGVGGPDGVSAHVNGYVEVSSAPYDKDVSIVYTVQGSDAWNEVPATFISLTTDGYERWFFELPPTPYVDNVSFQFAARYTADGVTVWDNNGGSDYVLGNGVDLGRQFVLGKPEVFVKSAGLSTFGGQTRMSGQLVLDNIAYEKDVDIVYTTDDWATTHVADAAYFDGPYPNNNCEDWTFQFTLPPISADSVRFAIAYTVDGATYWDDNFGWGYELDASGDYLFW